MNEKIKELIIESVNFELDPDSNCHEAQVCPEDLEHLAELIVRECAGIVEDYGLSLVSSDENYLGETLNISIRVQEAGNKIKQHFGVEE